jgi:hypothetical protein
MLAPENRRVLDRMRSGRDLDPSRRSKPARSNSTYLEALRLSILKDHRLLEAGSVRHTEELMEPDLTPTRSIMRETQAAFRAFPDLPFRSWAEKARSGPSHRDVSAPATRPTHLHNDVHSLPGTASPLYSDQARPIASQAARPGIDRQGKLVSIINT